MADKTSIPEPKGENRVRYCTDAFLYHVLERNPFWKQYRSDLKMYVGEQWDEKAVEELEAANKPHLTFNHIPRQINLLTGYERTERKRIIARPKGSEDVTKAAVVSGSLAHVDDISKAEYEKTAAAEDAFIMGEGILGFTYDHEQGRYSIKAESVFNCVPDRDCFDRDWTRSRIFFRFKWMSQNEIKQMFPTKAGEIDQMRPTIYMDWADGSDEHGFVHQRMAMPGYDMKRLPADQSTSAKKQWGEFYDAEERRWRVVECYERVSRPMSVVMEKTMDGEVQLARVPWHINEDGDIVQDETAVAKVIKDSETMTIQEKETYVWRVTVFAGDINLSDGFTKYPRLPFVPLYCYFKHDGEKKYIWGFVRKLSDPQVAYNKVRSQTVYALNKAVGNIIFLSSQLSKSVGADRLKEALRDFNAVVEFEGDSVAEGKDWAQLKPSQVPRELFLQSEELAGEMLDIGGLDPQAMLGIAEKGDPSGWAIELKQKQGIIQIATPFDNIRESHLTFYKEVVWPMIKNSNIKARVRKEMIPELGSRLQSTMPINMRPSEMTAEELKAMSEFMSPESINLLVVQDDVFNPLSDLDVDITFDETNFTTTERMRVLGMLIKMRESGLPIPPELIMEFTDEPVRDKIMAHLQMLKQQAAQMQGGQQPGGQPAQAPPGGQPV